MITQISVKPQLGTTKDFQNTFVDKMRLLHSEFVDLVPKNRLREGNAFKLKIQKTNK